MKIAVYGNDNAWAELAQSGSSIEWIRANDIQQLFSESDAAAYFNLTNDIQYSNTTGKPYFVNSVVTPLRELNAGSHAIRINGWNGFLKNSSWEICGNITDDVKNILSLLQKQIIHVADEPGFISARILSMVINEAFYAAGEKVSTAEEIDTAMKLGTNYPYGPFEWAGIIGIENIYALLEKLSETDTRYIAAPLLTQKIKS